MVSSSSGALNSLGSMSCGHLYGETEAEAEGETETEAEGETEETAKKLSQKCSKKTKLIVFLRNAFHDNCQNGKRGTKL